MPNQYLQHCLIIILLISQTILPTFSQTETTGSSTNDTNDLSTLRKEMDSLRSLVGQLQQKIVALEAKQERRDLVRQFQTSKVNSNSLPHNIKGDTTGDILDRIQSIERDLLIHKNISLTISKDYCTRILHDRFEANDPAGFSQAHNLCVDNLNFSLESIPAKFILGSLVSKPKARVYAGAELTGTFEDFNFDQNENPDCMSLKELAGGVQSLDTFGTCVRLYSEWTCAGHSVAFYPKSVNLDEENVDQNKTQLNMTHFLSTVTAVGPCFEQELDQCTFDVKNSVKTFNKLRALNSNSFLVPDSVFFGSGANPNRTGSLPITFYRTGYMERVEFIGATIYPRHVLQTKELNIATEDKEFYGGLEKQEGDKLGQFIGHRLGPQDDLPFHNVFPERASSRKLKGKFEEELVDWLSREENENKYLGMWIMVDYDTENSTRPTGMGIEVSFFAQTGRLIYLSNQEPQS